MIKRDSNDSINVVTQDSYDVLVQVLGGIHPAGAQTIILPDFRHQAVLALLQVVFFEFYIFFYIFFIHNSINSYDVVFLFPSYDKCVSVITRVFVYLCICKPFPPAAAHDWCVHLLGQAARGRAPPAG